MFKSVLFLVLMIFFSSCGKDSASMDTNLYFSYFPMESGTYVDYEVVEIQHDVNAAVTSDTSSYFLRTVIGDTVTDNQGRLSRKFIRKKRDSNNDIWEISDVWTTIIDQNRVEVVEENKRKVWLVLPPLSTTIWDLNAYNMLPNVSCNYEGIHDSFEMNGLQFDSVLTVEQENVLNFEPHLALFVEDDDPLVFYEAIINCGDYYGTNCIFHV